MRKIVPSEALRTGWQLIHDAKNVGREEKWFNGIPEAAAVKAEVPGFVHTYLPDCLGVAWYQLRFRTGLHPDADHVVTLNFGMADWLCEVYLNGRMVGVHRGNENAFFFDVTDFLNYDTENLLCVRVSKPHTEPVDGYTFGEIPHRNETPGGDLMPGSNYNEYGLHGAVSLNMVPRLRITDLYLNGNVDASCIELEFTVQNDYAFEAPGELSLLAGDKRTGDAEAEEISFNTFKPGETVFTRRLPIENVRLWDMDDPNLYFVTAELTHASTCHVVNKRCGFRTFCIGDDGYFYLNGRRILLRGSHTGNCMPESTHHLSRDKSLLRKDFSMAKSVGFNMIRFISGVALPEQLDLCDELGLMVYEEPLASWRTKDSDRAKEIYQYDLLNMIKRDRSHACVTIWGLLNETRLKDSYGQCSFIARESLGEVRDLDETRLVLFSSGRWDGDAFVGSVANPYHREWQYLLGGEGPDAPHMDPAPNSTAQQTLSCQVGDIHLYTNVPVQKDDVERVRAQGHTDKRPVFVSEFGVGSLFDVLWLQRKFEEKDADPNAPDVRMINGMANALTKDLKDWGFMDEFAFPSDIMRESYKFHNRHRSFGFDILRSNPYLNGISLTGLLDHSICGEGLWTLLREWKPGIADTLQDGFAPLRWCLMMSDTHVYSGRPFTIEGVLANEDVLKERKYTIHLRIMGENGPVWQDTVFLTPSAEDLKGMAVPVFKYDLTLDLPEGEYTLCAEIEEGAAAPCGRLSFFVSEDRNTVSAVSEVVGIALPEAAEAFLNRKGVRVLAPEEASYPTVVLMGNPAEKEKEAAWAIVRELLAKGSRVVSLCSAAAGKGEETSHYLPLESKPRRYARHDWLYHHEYLACRQHPYFAGMPTGVMNWYYYLLSIRGDAYRDDDTCRADDIAAAAVMTGAINSAGYDGGLVLATYNVGAGALILNSFSILENLNVNPAADRMLINIINAESGKIG